MEEIKKTIHQSLVSGGIDGERLSILVSAILNDLDTAGYVVIERPEVDPMEFAHPIPARRHGPLSSRIAAQWRPGRRALAYRLLYAHVHAWRSGGYLGFANAEVARTAGVHPNDKSCPHKRHGELADAGYLETVRDQHGNEVLREIDGELQEIRLLTPKGLALCDELGEPL